MNYTKQCMMFCAGAAAGSALAMLFAPKPGAEMRHDIADGLGKGKRAVTEGVGHTVEAARSAVTRNVELAKDAVKEGVEAYKETKQEFAKA